MEFCVEESKGFSNSQFILALVLLDSKWIVLFSISCYSDQFPTLACPRLIGSFYNFPSILQQCPDRKKSFKAIRSRVRKSESSSTRVLSVIGKQCRNAVTQPLLFQDHLSRSDGSCREERTFTTKLEELQRARHTIHSEIKFQIFRHNHFWKNFQSI